MFGKKTSKLKRSKDKKNFYWFNKVCKSTISLFNSQTYKQETRTSLSDTPGTERSPVPSVHDSSPEESILLNSDKRVPQDREALDGQCMKQSKMIAVQLSQKETDEINQRLQTDTMKRNKIKANRLKQQKDSALLETMNLFNENFYTHRKDESIFILNDTNKHLSRNFEEHHQILIW